MQEDAREHQQPLPSFRISPGMGNVLVHHSAVGLAPPALHFGEI